MSYQISQAYCWYNEGTMIVKMYFVNQIPFTFDELPYGHMYDEDLKRLADKQRSFDPEDLFNEMNSNIMLYIRNLYDFSLIFLCIIVILLGI